MLSGDGLIRPEAATASTTFCSMVWEPKPFLRLLNSWVIQ